MKVYKSLTDELRKSWKEWAEAIAGAEPYTLPGETVLKAREFLAYEASLQAKDTMIATLRQELEVANASVS